MKKNKIAFLVFLLLAFVSILPLSAKNHSHHKKIKYESKSRHVGFNFNFSPTDLFLGYALLNSRPIVVEQPVVRECVVVTQPQVVQQHVYYNNPQYYPNYPNQVVYTTPTPTYVQQTYVYR